MVQPQCIRGFRALSRHAQQPSEIGIGPNPDRMAGQQHKDYYRGRYLCGRLWLYHDGGTKKDVLTKVLLPGSVPLIISNMKVNIGLCLVGVIIGEFLAANKGLGYLIIYGSQVFKMDLVVMSIVILCIVSAILYQGITVLEKRMK